MKQCEIKNDLHSLRNLFHILDCYYDFNAIIDNRKTDKDFSCLKSAIIQMEICLNDLKAYLRNHDKDDNEKRD